MSSVPDPLPDSLPSPDPDDSFLSPLPTELPYDGPVISAPSGGQPAPDEGLPDPDEGGEEGVDVPDVEPDVAPD